MSTLPLSPAGRRYGRLPSPSDVRDRRMNTAPIFRLPVAQLPPRFDLLTWCGPIKDQGQEGSCTGHAYSSIREFLARKYQNESPILSPQFLYAEELIYEGNFPDDQGAASKTGCLILDQFGCCEEKYYPYKVEHIVTPTSAQLSNAKKWIGGAYHRIFSLDDALSCIYSGYPFSIGFSVYESFESDKVANTGIMPMPKPDESLLGGHEVFCVGYDSTKELALIQNSWGSSWGAKGHFWMPFAFLSDPGYVSDIWLSHLGRPWRP